MKRVIENALAVFAFGNTGITQDEIMHDQSCEQLKMNDKKNAEDVSVRPAFQH
ncbi:MAG: hypothetical protein SOI44_06755 [Lactimicrobium sp.]|jgi:hypothetical protein|uniref:hypothetical protein n=1 Tax=Lactimicrobium sp. TaxID=2563780 RepID=UPI002F34FC73